MLHLRCILTIIIKTIFICRSSVYELTTLHSPQQYLSFSFSFSFLSLLPHCQYLISVFMISVPHHHLFIILSLSLTSSFNHPPPLCRRAECPRVPARHRTPHPWGEGEEIKVVRGGEERRRGEEGMRRG